MHLNTSSEVFAFAFAFENFENKVFAFAFAFDLQIAKVFAFAFDFIQKYLKISNTFQITSNTFCRDGTMYQTISTQVHVLGYLTDW